MKTALVGAQVAAALAAIGTARAPSQPEMQDLAVGMLVRKDGEHVPLETFLNLDFSEAEKRLMSAYDDPSVFAEMVAPGYVPHFDLSGLNPYDSIVWRAPRADRRLANRAYGSGGKKYATEKGRSKDARKARAATRKSRK